MTMTRRLVCKRCGEELVVTVCWSILPSGERSAYLDGALHIDCNGDECELSDEEQEAILDPLLGGSA
jgi:hypothetical protein